MKTTKLGMLICFFMLIISAGNVFAFGDGGGGSGSGDGGSCSNCGSGGGSTGGGSTIPDPPVCGDLVLEGDEDCDDGNTISGDGCSSDCSLEYCGDGTKQPSEECDDGNNVDGDGCSASCLIEVPTCCDDGDCGVDHFEGNTYCIGEDLYQNYVIFTCNNPGDFLNSYCSDIILPWLIEECEYGCANGACINPVCGDGIIQGYEECDDGNLFNNDGCSSSCENEEIECYDNFDCGIDYFLGNEYCLGDDLYDDYKVYTCNNPGQYNSYCSEVILPWEIEVCFFGCANDECIDPVCGDGVTQGYEECDDGNLFNNDGCSDSCEIEYPSCYDNSECGTDHFIGDTYCIFDDLYQDYMFFTCENAGLFNSYCSNDVTAELIEECAFGCVNGACINPDCGNGIEEGLEECDDGNLINGDGCDSNCEIEIPVNSDCGNGIIEGNEECDDGNDNGVKCDNSDSSCTYCSNSCKIIERDKKKDCNGCCDDDDEIEFISYCEPNWICSGWSECIEGLSKRTCEDQNNCEDEYNKPSEQISCESLNSNVYSEEDNTWIWIIAGILIALLLLIILFNLLS